jgi:hypothetical protein
MFAGIDSSFTGSAIPEPSTLMLFAGAATVLFWQRHRASAR